MKKAVFPVVLTILALAQACQKEVASVESLSTEYSYTFALDESEELKSSLEGHRIVWESGDKVGVYTVSGESVSANRAGAVTLGNPCTFTVSSSVALKAGDYVYAYAPYNASAGTAPTAVSLTVPAEQNQTVTIFDGASLPLVAIPAQMTSALNPDTDRPLSTLRFANVAALLRFNIYSSSASYVGENIQEVRFAASSAICGTGTLNLKNVQEGSDATFALSGCTGKTVTTRVSGSLGTPSSKASAVSVYMGVVPATCTGTVTVITDKSDYVFTLSTAVAFGRNKMQPFSLDLANAGTIYPDTEVSFATVRGKAGDETTTLSNTMFNGRAYIEGLVLGDAGDPNMEQNLAGGFTVDGLSVYENCVSPSGARPNANNIFTWENDRTNYVESKDGSYGFRIKFSGPDANTLQRGDKVRIWLDGVKMVKETGPERYTIFNISHLEVVDAGQTIPVKNKTLSSLTDADIYTWVKISDLEFQIKRGCYANVREYDAIINPINEGIGYDELDVDGVRTKSFPAKDGAANLLYDGSGKGIYMLMNMNCAWRWNPSTKMRKQVPQGKGTMAGVLVHQLMERWGGNVGAYSIRPLEEGDIQFTGTSDWQDLVEWGFNLNTDAVGSFSWNSSTGTGGYDEKATGRNRLNATEATGMINNTGTVAQLYSGTNVNTPGTYGFSPEASYRAFNVSDYRCSKPTRNVEHKFGMAFTAMTFREYVYSFYEWDASGNWTGGVKGPVAEFSTAGKSASQVAIGFSMAGGYYNKSNANISWTRSSSFPIDWKVQWSTSHDGTTWTAWSDNGVANIATNVNALKLRSIPFATDKASMIVSYADAAAKSPVNTQAEWGFGMVPYRFSLPAGIMGQYKVRVRIVPTSLKMAEWNEGNGAEWTRSQEYKGGEISQSLPFSGPYTAITLEDVKVQYK
ncbi:MAG: hypothetical protein IJU13_05700 [Bacteroidales bacterium]|nr:hypothetical protein [Bacteroidales bacterium]